MRHETAPVFLLALILAAVHDAVNVGAGPLKLVGVYVVEKGKPLATPAK